jgi:hypothetical protein
MMRPESELLHQVTKSLANVLLFDETYAAPHKWAWDVSAPRHDKFSSAS